MTFSDWKHCRSPKTAPLLPQKDVDFGHSETGFDGASFSGAVFNLSTTIVGAGIMALPATLKQLGAIPGLIVIILAAMLTEKASKSASYSGIAGDAFGGFGRTLLQACIVINNLGTPCCLRIIIGDVLSGTLSDGVHYSGCDGRMVWPTGGIHAPTYCLLRSCFAPLISFKRVGEHSY
ncbi:hypothetical protein HAX54_038304 [Datura stramonium]|uniref:Amino acid transporter transmembrane domain-containing protein n=1 Tax=Datura stramonium TaxID=4076 RepID=A0ABS8VMZ9_DATST|nr:hypothetical protein [Datura stramonium]